MSTNEEAASPEVVPSVMNTSSDDGVVRASAELLTTLSEHPEMLSDPKYRPVRLAITPLVQSAAEKVLPTFTVQTPTALSCVCALCRWYLE